MHIISVFFLHIKFHDLTSSVASTLELSTAAMLILLTRKLKNVKFRMITADTIILIKPLNTLRQPDTICTRLGYYAA